MKHTPGPWYAVEYAGHIDLQIQPEYSADYDLLEADIVGVEQMTANGRLAAAAPEIAEALRCAFLWHNKGHFIHEGLTYKVGLNDATAFQLVHDLSINALQKSGII